MGLAALVTLGGTAVTLLKWYWGYSSTKGTRPTLLRAEFEAGCAAVRVCAAEAKRLIGTGGMYCNGRRMAPIDDSDRAVGSVRVRRGDLLDDHVLLLRTGKRNYRVVLFR